LGRLAAGCGKVIVEIDGYYENVLLIGKPYSISELRNQLVIIKGHCITMNEFADVFCRLFQYERLSSTSKEDIRPDIVIDTETDLVYKIRY